MNNLESQEAGEGSMCVKRSSLHLVLIATLDVECLYPLYIRGYADVKKLVHFPKAINYERLITYSNLIMNDL